MLRSSENCQNEKIVFELLKASLFTDESVDCNDWDDAFAEMKAQSVAALAGDWLKKNPVSSEWSSYCAMQQAQWIRVMHGQSQMLELLEENDISCVILKGAAAAVYYPNPSLRTMGDVDFLVKRSDFERTAALLEENGYTLSHEKNPDMHHYGYQKDRISFELHKRLAVIRESDEKLISLFEQGIENREIRELEGYTVPVLPVELNGLVLIFHINQHLRSGLGLRQIIDWMMYMDKLPEEVWKEKLLPLLRETGMEKLALTVTVICQKYLGLRTIVDPADNYPCDELMEYIMEKGNFGRKAGIEGRTAAFSLSSTNIGKVFRRLQAGGMSRWEAAKKYKILQPFAWMYQGFRILGVLRKENLSPREVLLQQRKGIEQRELLEKLGLGIEREVK